MAGKIFKHKWLKVAAIILASLTAVVLVAALLLNHYWSPLLSKKLKSTVTEATDSLYKVDFADANVKILQGRIVIYNLTLKPDTAVYRKKVKAHKAPNNLYEVKVGRLVLKHIHPFKAYFQKRIDIGQIVLNEPELRATYIKNHTQDTTVKYRSIYEKIKKSLKSVHVGEIWLNNVKLTYENYTGSKTAVSKITELNLIAKDLLIDSATQRDTSRFLYCKDVSAEVNNFTWQTKDKLYTIKAKKLRLSTAASQLHINGFSITPSADYFDRKHNDRFTIRFDTINANNFNYLAYSKTRTIRASAVRLSKGSISIANESWPYKNTNLDKVSTFPQNGLKKISADMNIDTLRIKDIDVRYNEFNRKTKRWGDIYFSNASGTLRNITTSKAALLTNNICSVNLRSNFMGKGQLNVKFRFNLTSPDLDYDYSGSLGPMDLGRLNSATVPLAMVKLTSGRANSLKFDIKANRNRSRGRVSFLYNDLKVKLLRVGEDKALAGKPIVSLLANAFIIKRNNPDDPSQAPRYFDVTYLRPYNSPFFKTVWKTLLTGLKPCVGFDQVTEKEMAVKMSERDKKKLEKERKKKLKEMKEKQEEKKKEAEEKRKKANEKKRD